MPAFETPAAAPLNVDGSNWWRAIRWCMRTVRRPWEMEFPTPVPSEEQEAEAAMFAEYLDIYGDDFGPKTVDQLRQEAALFRRYGHFPFADLLDRLADEAEA